jgi:adenosine deaminase
MGGVVALGLGGSENQFPPRLFKDAFQIAVDRGLFSVPHAGEQSGSNAGPMSVRSAIYDLCATRIGHGVRASEGPDLL